MRETRATPSRPPGRGRRSCVAALRAAPLIAGWVAAGVVAASCSSPATPSRDARLRLVATLPPLAWLATGIGGDRVEVRTLLGPRADPELGSLTLSAARALADSDLVVAVGSDLLAFERQLLRSLPADRPPVLLAADSERGDGGAHLDDHRDVHEDDADRDHRGSHGGHHDAHPWLDPDQMGAAAARLAARLEALDPGGADEYRRGLRAVLGRIEVADAAIRARLGAASGAAVLLSEHPTWEVLARRYGVRVMAIEQEEREVSARRLRDAVDLARGAGVSALAVSAGGRQGLARAVARELGVEIVELEPLAYDWLDSLERAAALSVARPRRISQREQPSWVPSAESRSEPTSDG